MTDRTADESFLAGPSEMAALMRAYDWASSPLGPPAAWPQSLKTAISIVLASGYPMYIAWGPEFIQFYNDAYRPILGATKHPAGLGQPTPECFAEIWEFIGPMFRRALETGKATTLTDQLLPLDRNGFVEECYFTFSYSAVRDESGSFGGVFVTVMETTHRVLNERRMAVLRDFATASSEVRTTRDACALVEAISARDRYDLPFALLYTLDSDGVSARLAGATGLERGTALSPETIAAAADAPWPFEAVARDGNPVPVMLNAAECAGVAADIWPEPVRRAMVLPITQPGHASLAGFLVAGTSARLQLDPAYTHYLELLANSVSTALLNARAYEEERSRAEALTELDRAKTAFFSNVSHEFRTPLTLILGKLEEILDGPGDALPLAIREGLETVHRNGLRLLKLVNTLLDFSRIEAGRMQALYQPTDLGSATLELASMFRSAIENAGIAFNVDCPPTEEPAFIDREMWDKVVLNLVSNAFKFTEVGRIEVRVARRDDVFELTVSDTGTGITPEQLPHIFERFHRVEGVRARSQEGTGIGLALVRELVRLQGGSVAVASDVGQGTTFTVTLPAGSAHVPPDRIGTAEKEQLQAPHAAAYIEEASRWLPDRRYQAAGGPLSGRPTIVLADDNADMRDYVAGLLSTKYDVIATPDGLAALQAVRGHLPDLVLCDVMMPGLDGFQLLEAIRADPAAAGTQVIFLSARAGEEARVEGLEAGADDYLIKPFSAKELLARIDSHLELRRVRREAAEVQGRLLAELQVERRRLNSLFAQAPAFMAVLRGPAHVFEMANPAYYQLVGHRDIIGKSVEEALPEIKGQGFIEILDGVYETGTPFVGTNMRVNLQPELGGPLEERYVDFTYQPLYDADQAVYGILAHGVDLSVHHQTERALQESRAALALAVDGAELGTFYCEMPLDKIIWNARCKEHFFLPPDAEVDFALFYSLLHPDDRDRTRQAIDRCINDRVQYNVEYRTIAPDGRSRWLNAVGKAYYGEDGAPYRFDGITIDITERKEREAQIQSLNAKLRRAMTETHHRVKNNLQLISALIEMQKQSGQQIVPMTEMTRLGQNIQALGVIHDLLTQEARADGEADYLSAKVVLERLLPSLRSTMGARTLEAHLEEVLLPSKQTTSVALLANELVSNAVKHGQGAIELTLAAKGATVTLEVCDDGPGFPPDFDPQRTANVGLELIDTIARYDLRGSVAFENRDPGGARVVITFINQPYVAVPPAGRTL